MKILPRQVPDILLRLLCFAQPLRASASNASPLPRGQAFRIDLERCPQRGARLRIVASIEAPDVISTILSHLADHEDGRTHRARAPPPTPGGLAPRIRSPFPDPTCRARAKAPSLLAHRAPGSTLLPRRIRTFQALQHPHGGSEVPAPDPSNGLEPNTVNILCRPPSSMGYFPNSHGERARRALRCAAAPAILLDVANLA